MPTLCTTQKGIILRLGDHVSVQDLGGLVDLLDAGEGEVVMTNAEVIIKSLPEGHNVLLASAPGVSQKTLDDLRSHVLRQTLDPDYTIVTNFTFILSGRTGQKAL